RLPCRAHLRKRPFDAVDLRPMRQCNCKYVPFISALKAANKMRAHHEAPPIISVDRAAEYERVGIDEHPAEGIIRGFLNRGATRPWMAQQVNGVEPRP